MPADHEPGDTPIADRFDFSDLNQILADIGLIPGDPSPPDPTTPDDALEELDAAEADEDAPTDDDDPAGANRTWAELDECVEAERRFRLDFLSQTSAIFAAHTACAPGDEPTGAEWKLKGMEPLPEAARVEFVRFLTEMARTAGKLAARCGEVDE